MGWETVEDENLTVVIARISGTHGVKVHVASAASAEDLIGWRYFMPCRIIIIL